MRPRILRLELADFRNYQRFELEPAEGLTILVGPNAVGKTNVVEALELVTEASSFRNPSWNDVIRHGAVRALVSMRAESQGVETEINLAVESGRRAYRVNGAAKRAVSDVSGTVPAVVFTPDDLRLVKDSAERRRMAADSVGTQASRAYGQLKAEYERVLRQRNALLREIETDDASIAPWTEQLVFTGAALTARRKKLVSRLSEHARREYELLSQGEELTVTYHSPWMGPERSAAEGRVRLEEEPPERNEEERIERERMTEALHSKRSEERARRTTLVGPHRDDLLFEIDGRDARAFASQGQQRSIALAWKLAELEVIESLNGKTPALLLDDVMSELDETRRHALATRVGDRTQTIVTTTNLGYFEKDLIDAAKVVELT